MQPADSGAKHRQATPAVLAARYPRPVEHCANIDCICHVDYLYIIGSAFGTAKQCTYCGGSYISSADPRGDGDDAPAG